MYIKMRLEVPGSSFKNKISRNFILSYGIQLKIKGNPTGEMKFSHYKVLFSYQVSSYKQFWSTYKNEVYEG